MSYNANYDAGMAPRWSWMHMPSSEFSKITEGDETDDRRSRRYAQLVYQVNSPPITISGDVYVDSVGLDDTGTVKLSGDQLKVFDQTAIDQLVALNSKNTVLYSVSGDPVSVRDFETKHYLNQSFIQDVRSSDGNTTVANLNAGATFTGTAVDTFGVVGLQVNAIADQPLRIEVQQSVDGSNWDIEDEYEIFPGIGDGRTIQATANYLRVVVTNLGAIATTYCRIQTILCPIADPVPRALTKNGLPKLTTQTVSFSPDPENFTVPANQRALQIDTERNLRARAQVLTDEQSFRDDFANGDTKYVATGTVYFRNGETYVIGVGTNFIGELKIGEYIKLSTDADSYYTKIADVYSDTVLLLEEGYLGSTGNGTAWYSYWKYSIDAGCSADISGSILVLESGTVSGEICQAARDGDYLPFNLTFGARVTQRIANQELSIGFADNDTPGLIDNQVMLVFSGTDNTKVIFRTSFSGNDVQETEVTLEGGDTTASLTLYEIVVDALGCCLLVSGKKRATHYCHIPDPYAVLNIYATAYNTDTAASSTALVIDTIAFVNHNTLDASIETDANPVQVKNYQASTSTVTSVAGAAADTMLLAYNVNRLGATIFNDSTATLYLKLGTGSSLTSYTVQILPDAYYEVPYNYIGQINGYWDSTVGNARITELT